jgi:hypothetical protein
LDFVGGPRSVLGKKGIDVCKHPLARKLLDEVALSFETKGSGIWRGDYLVCKDTFSGITTIPQKYIIEALQKLQLSDTTFGKQGLCIYFPGGSAALKSKAGGYPMLVYEDPDHSGTCNTNPRQHKLRS